MVHTQAHRKHCRCQNKVRLKFDFHQLGFFSLGLTASDTVSRWFAYFYWSLLPLKHPVTGNLMGSHS